MEKDEKYQLNNGDNFFLCGNEYPFRLKVKSRNSNTSIASTNNDVQIKNTKSLKETSDNISAQLDLNVKSSSSSEWISIPKNSKTSQSKTSANKKSNFQEEEEEEEIPLLRKTSTNRNSNSKIVIEDENENSFFEQFRFGSSSNINKEPKASFKPKEILPELIKVQEEEDSILLPELNLKKKSKENVSTENVSISLPSPKLEVAIDLNFPDNQPNDSSNTKVDAENPNYQLQKQFESQESGLTEDEKLAFKLQEEFDKERRIERERMEQKDREIALKLERQYTKSKRARQSPSRNLDEDNPSRKKRRSQPKRKCNMKKKNYLDPEQLEDDVFGENDEFPLREEEFSDEDEDYEEN